MRESSENVYTHQKFPQGDQALKNLRFRHGFVFPWINLKLIRLQIIIGCGYRSPSDGYQSASRSSSEALDLSLLVVRDEIHVETLDGREVTKQPQLCTDVEMDMEPSILKLSLVTPNNPLILQVFDSVCMLFGVLHEGVEQWLSR
ncbi:hypothetical protein MPDQ_003619 [Monascus purpureus]|uniref:Uncharacterized protein n=1 Tax=Monascus purpureus TaxID=5098 RepID=A0A507QIF1_MONPU|nr:hypothetical protein MPDQ_003619 [Monascus purpureus]